MVYAKDFIEIDLGREKIPLEKLIGIDVVIHLMGESVDGYWTKTKKKSIYDSRILSSQNLVESILRLPAEQKKPIVVSASAQGIYGDANEQILIESDVLDQASGDFLQQVCKDWERPFLDLAQATGTRTVQLRFPMVLDPNFGALKKLIGVFNKNVGAVFSDGRQWVSWAASEDIINIIVFMINSTKTHGPFNCAAPGPLTNKDFTHALAKKLNVFTLPSVPRLVLKTLFGEMSSLFLNSTRLSSERLTQLGYQFKWSRFEDYLNHALKKQ